MQGPLRTWEPTTYRSISDWGHLPVGRTILDQLEQFRIGARSLARPERTVPALGGSGIPDD
ncbi:extradiol ring cleaving catechol dioxygenase [Streptomyces malaysiensis]|uniref:Extradiol ring cleaving catechol dioxygenase n=1 Tax=Streptomyces malaysiensis TaxID=92644 RepID=A0A7X5WZ63_STRMQ|nr:extradiol ring cleaving catechol dioxygenase [Streptomyces malaysiensis]